MSEDTYEQWWKEHVQNFRNIISSDGYKPTTILMEIIKDICKSAWLSTFSERAVLVQYLREIEALAGSHSTEPDYTLIYSKACAALNYAEVTE